MNGLTDNNKNHGYITSWTNALWLNCKHLYYRSVRTMKVRYMNTPQSQNVGRHHVLSPSFLEPHDWVDRPVFH